MRIFALETDISKATRSFMTEGERQLFIVRYHPFLFIIRLARQCLFAFLLLLLYILGLEAGLPVLWMSIGYFVALLVFIVPSIVRSYIDWKFDAIVVTNDRVIIMDQTSIFHSEVRQMHLENFASVNAVTQFWNIFPFGMLCFDLKEGIGHRLCLRYIPNAQEVALKVSNCVRQFQMGAAARMHQHQIPPQVNVD